MKSFMAAVAAFATAMGIGYAQQEVVSNPRGVVANFDIDNLGPVLTELGAVWQRRAAPNGQPYIALSAGGELTLNIIPTACQGDNYTGCLGMNTIALFSGAQLNYQTVSAFNQKYAFSTAGITEDGDSAYLSRYEIADYGIPRGNVASSLINLVTLASRFRNELRTSVNTISQEGYAEDMSSRLLNSRGLNVISGRQSAGGVTLHEAAFEESAELITMLLESNDAPRNKIENITAKN